MKAAWDWDLPRETPEQRRDLVAFAADCGFDTLVVGDPSETLVAAGRDHGVRIVATVMPYPDEEFMVEHPYCLQRMRPEEEEAAALLAARPGDHQTVAHQQFPRYRTRDVLCFEHPESREWLTERVRDALDVADGVALDGFGFRNRYGCFCERCRERRRERSADGDPLDPAAMRDASEDSLVEISEVLYDAAKAVDSDALVTNHVWPPFDPNPYYAHRLRLDYCTQTIAWFRPPTWSMERVEFEAAEHARLEEPDRNTFVPFVGMFTDEYRRRSPERVRRELEVGLEYGDGNVVFCTLGGPREDERLRNAVRSALD